MKTRHTVELAALVSTHAAAIAESAGEIPPAAHEDFLSAFRDRCSFWTRTFAACEFDGGQATGFDGTIEDLLVCDTLVRVWAAVLASHDVFNGRKASEPVARHVLCGQMKARQLALRLLLDAAEEEHDVVGLDRLRRRCERWADLLLSPFVARYGMDEFAFEPDRARDFAEDGAVQVWPIVLAGVRNSFRDLPELTAVTSSNHELAAAVLHLFPADAFETDGPLRSLSGLRVRRSGHRPERSFPQDVPLPASHRAPTQPAKRRPRWERD